MLLLEKFVYFEDYYNVKLFYKICGVLFDELYFPYLSVSCGLNAGNMHVYSEQIAPR